MNEEANKETPNTNAETAEQPKKTGKSKVWKIVGICVGVIAAIAGGAAVACACTRKGETAPVADPEPVA